MIWYDILCHVISCHVIYYIIYYNLMGSPSYMRSVVDRNVVTRRIPLQRFAVRPYLSNSRIPFLLGIRCKSNKPLRVWRKGKKYERTNTAEPSAEQNSMTALFYPMLPDSTSLCEASQPSQVRPYNNIVMRRITTFLSTTDNIYNGGPIRLSICLSGF